MEEQSSLAEMFNWRKSFGANTLTKVTLTIVFTVVILIHFFLFAIHPNFAFLLRFHDEDTDNLSLMII